jgi:hypothetical protein
MPFLVVFHGVSQEKSQKSVLKISVKISVKITEDPRVFADSHKSPEICCRDPSIPE